MSSKGKDKTSPEIKGFATHLSEAGKYSYAAICALSLHELYSSEWDVAFSKQCTENFVKYLELPKQVKETMTCLTAGYTEHTYQAYVEMLLAEPTVHANPVPVIQDLVVFAISTGKYDARTRVLVLHVAGLLGAPRHLVLLVEEALGYSLLTASSKKSKNSAENDSVLTPEQQALSTKRARRRKFRRYALIGLATVTGGALLGLTGGLVAPLIGAGVGTIVGGGAAAVIGSTAGAAIIGSLFGVAGAGLTGYRMKRRVGEIEEFEFASLNGDSCSSPRQMHIVIAISGWLDQDDSNFCWPWRTLRASQEQYFLKYESVFLRQLGAAFNILIKAAMSSAIQHALRFTILRGLLAAVAWPSSLVSLSNVIDNPWGTCLRRSAQVGRHLAEVLLSRHHGSRPVTLVGYSLGARVIFYCLRELADRHPGSEGIVQDAYMLGAPVTGSRKDWEDICTVVAGRLVNGYCRTDWLLKFLYRTTSVQVTIAGLSEVTCSNPRLKNVDLTEVVTGHLEYASNIEELLKLVGVRTLDVVDRTVRLHKSNSEVFPSHSKPPRSLRHAASLPAIFGNVEDRVDKMSEPLSLQLERTEVMECPTGVLLEGWGLQEQDGEKNLQDVAAAFVDENISMTNVHLQKERIRNLQGSMGEISGQDFDTLLVDLQEDESSDLQEYRGIVDRNLQDFTKIVYLQEDHDVDLRENLYESDMMMKHFTVQDLPGSSVDRHLQQFTTDEHVGPSLLEEFDHLFRKNEVDLPVAQNVKGTNPFLPILPDVVHTPDDENLPVKQSNEELHSCDGSEA